MFRSISLGMAILGMSVPIHAQLVAVGPDTSALLQGIYLEWGVNSCGVFGVADSLVLATDGPLGPYHPNAALGLGAVYSPGGTWTGLDVCGDYWVPGSPEESFGVEWDGSPGAFINRSLFCGVPVGMPGNVRAYTDVAGIREVRWEGFTADPAGTLRVRQSTVLAAPGRMVRTTVEVCNQTASPVTGLYYARSVDPDNEQVLTGQFSTRNTVFSQPPGGGAAVVTAEGLDYGCLMALVSADPRSRAAVSNAASTYALTSPKAMWEGGPGYLTGSGSVFTFDYSIGLAFRVDLLMPGACTEWTMYHVVDAGALSGVIDSLVACPQPVNLTAESQPTRANLRWDGPSSALGYRLYGGPAGGTPVVRNVMADSIRIGGLNPGTTYQWTVRSICGVDTLSEAAPVRFFTTPLLRTAGALADWSMVPNPASGRVRLQGEDLARAETLEVLDPAGRLLRRERLAGADAHDLALHGLAPGLYLVVLRGPAGTGHRRLVVE